MYCITITILYIYIYISHSLSLPPLSLLSPTHISASLLIFLSLYLSLSFYLHIGYPSASSVFPFHYYFLYTLYPSPPPPPPPPVLPRLPIKWFPTVMPPKSLPTSVYNYSHDMRTNMNYLTLTKKCFLSMVLNCRFQSHGNLKLHTTAGNLDSCIIPTRFVL